jgi:ABC-type sugar transport system ATPase subunit
MGRITLDKVSKSLATVEVIPPLDLTIEDGEFAVFVGPSGCGKSTLLRLIAGLEDVTGGEIRIDGQDATTVPPAKRGLAMVFQSYALYPHMSVRKNIAFPLRMAGLDKAEQRPPGRTGGRRPEPDRLSRPSAGAAFGRTAPAGRHRARHCARTCRVPVRRAACRTSTPRCGWACGSRSASCTTG